MTPAARSRLARLGILAAVIVGFVVLGEVTGLRKQLDIAHMRELVARAGAFGVLCYVGVFIIGELVHVPGLVFVAAGIAIWGRWPGGVYAWAAAVISVAASFLVVRGVGGKALAEIQNPRIRRVLAHLETRPLATVAALRAVLIISPPVTYALALSPVRFLPFFLGSALGLLPPMALATVFFEQLLRWLGATGS